MEELLGDEPRHKVVRTATVPVITVNQTALEVGDGTSVDSILIPTDGSEPSQTAALLGADLAVQLNADVHCLSVVDEDLSDDLESALKNGDDFLSSLAEENVDRTLKGLQECPRECVGATATDDPAEEIITYAEEQDVDLIVMGTHGRGGFDLLVIGSVTDSVIRGAPVPVLAERVTEEELSGNTAKGK